MIARRDMALAAGLYLFGVFSAAFVMVVFSTHGRQTVLRQPVALRGKSARPSFSVAYVIPRTLYAGDSAVVRATVRNERVRFEDARTHAPTAATLGLALKTGGPCAATPDDGGARRFPAVGGSVAYSWHLTGTNAGGCRLAFKSSVPLVRFSAFKRMTVPVSIQSAPAKIVAVLGGGAGLVGLGWATLLVFGLSASADGHIRTAPRRVRRAVCAPGYAYAMSAPTLAPEPTIVRWWDRERGRL